MGKLISIIVYSITGFFTWMYLSYVLLYGANVFAIAIPYTTMQVTYFLIVFGMLSSLASMQGTILKLVMRQEREIMWTKSTQPDNETSDKYGSLYYNFIKVFFTSVLWLSFWVMSYFI